MRPDSEERGAARQSAAARHYLVLNLIALALLIVMWGYAMHRGPGPGLLNDVLIILFVAPGAVVGSLTFGCFRLRLDRTHAAVAAICTYLILGIIYAVTRPPGQIESFTLRALFWPTLVLWQDLCHTGIWPCPID